MVVINKNTDKVYYTPFKSRVAEIIGVHRNTVTKWAEKSKKEYYNYWVIYFDINY